MGFVDLHSHVLPGLDDGARDSVASLAMVRGLAGLGFEIICATPHQKAGSFMPTRAAIDAAHEALMSAVADAGLTVTIPLAAENMWDEVFFARVQARRIPSYDDGPAFLFELTPDALPVGLDQHVYRIRAAGALPVMAHPERYRPLWKSPALVEGLARHAALVVDLGAVAGYHGRGPSKAARRLLEDGLAHAAASDAHAPEDVRVAAEGIAWIRKRLGDAAVARLLADNPRRILAGEHPEA
ncbi:tyrosine-protein phosphatase [Haliangium sp.]|uniref:tyrosine-protein phosphatase n=1 Tax=Haliangium sp. TaxID=2663208 RepID=UPI003D11070A